MCLNLDKTQPFVARHFNDIRPLNCEINVISNIILVMIDIANHKSITNKDRNAKSNFIEITSIYFQQRYCRF